MKAFYAFDTACFSVLRFSAGGTYSRFKLNFFYEKF